MNLRLPVSGLNLKFKNGHLRELNADLAAHDRTIADLGADQWLTAARLVQVGRKFEQTITVEEADEIIDAEKEGGVDFDELLAAMVRAVRGKMTRPLKIHTLDELDAEEGAADDAPKKSDLTRVAPMGRVS